MKSGLHVQSSESSREEFEMLSMQVTRKSNQLMVKVWILGEYFSFTCSDAVHPWFILGCHLRSQVASGLMLGWLCGTRVMNGNRMGARDSNREGVDRKQVCNNRTHYSFDMIDGNDRNLPVADLRYLKETSSQLWCFDYTCFVHNLWQYCRSNMTPMGVALLI